MDRDIETREVNDALKKALFDEAIPSLCLGLVMVLAGGVFLFDSVPLERLLLWGGSLCLISGLRALQVWWVKSRAYAQVPTRLYNGLMVLTGAAWGCVILMWSAELPLVDQLIIALLPVLAALGALLSIGHWPPTYRGFIGAMLMAMIICMGALTNENFARLLIPLALVASGCLYCSYRLYLQKREMLLLRLRNQQALRSKDEFLARMSHELRTPMNGVLGMVRMLGKTQLSPEQQVLVATLSQSGKDMLGMVSDLLDAASLASRDVRLAPEPCDPSEVTRSVVDVYRHRSSSKRLSIELELDPAIPAWVNMDAARWRQICRKLLDNAVNFTDRGHISAQLNHVDTHLVMTIRDTGCGIEESQLQAVMEVFHQVQSDSQRRVGGAGIGLPIARSLVELMGGTLQIESESGKGTCVTVSVPLDIMPVPQQVETVAMARTAEKPAEQSAVPTTAAALKRQSDQTPIRALVAEDNLVNQLVINAALEGLGCETTVVENGLKALAALQVSRFDIVFMDCQMPELDGFETTRQARDNGFQLPIVAVTANAVAGDRERCLAAGMDDYVSKPFADDDLKRMLEKWLGNPQLQTPPAHAA